jgi:hypothetical protein
MKKTLQLIFMGMALMQGHLFSQNISNDSLISKPCSKKVSTFRGTLGTYANPPRFEDGRVNLQVLISELKDIHANTYNWLIRTNHDDLETLKLFLPLAHKAKLKVWATLVPPSEPPASEPFKLDFERWASELATLSLAQPNLVAWSIDDFVHNLKIYTPEYVGKFLAAACAINPKLAFMPCCYYKQITPSFVTNYGPLLDGILFPYRAESVGANLQDASQVGNEIAKLRVMFGPKFPIVLDIYASGHSRLGASTPEYVKEVLVAGLKTADGVLIFRHQDPVKFPDKYQIIKKGFR